MREDDVEIPVENYDWSPNDQCLLTNEPAIVRPVMLRRMWLLGAVWVGEAVSVRLPLAKHRSFAIAQYLRMLRPYFAGFFSLAFLLNLPVGGESSIMVAVRLIILVVGFLIPWCALGWLLKKMEPIRLVKLSRDKRTATVRFVDSAAAIRAKKALTCGACSGPASPPERT